MPSPTGETREPLLAVHDLWKQFHGVQAVRDCTLKVHRNTITGLIGPNGAGKTTLFNLVAGAERPDRGRITFRGERIDGLRPHAVFGRGLYRTFQTPREFETLTVLENLMLIPPHQRGESVWGALLAAGPVQDEETALLERARETLEFVELDRLRNDLAGTLSGGQRKLLELARALMAHPTLVLLDEPGAGVNPTLLRRIAGKIEEMAADGITFLLIEHDMELVMRLCHPILVMSEGALLASGSGAEIRRNERVLAAYLGGQYRAGATN